uniref:Uncharacterized protein n=1 Tax=Psilocybe cubensis TaxID=181762 RepID=A0A8H7XSG0_PSICU
MSTQGMQLAPTGVHSTPHATKTESYNTIQTPEPTVSCWKGCNVFKSNPASKLKYELPETVKAAREGWQWTCQSGAVVSGLLAAAAAQLLVFFKTDSTFNPDINTSGGWKGFILGMCYMALFLNISATISSFILIDNLGEIGFRASCNSDNLEGFGLGTGKLVTNQDNLLIKFGASPAWRMMLYHWLITFYAGIVTLIVSILTYVILQESLAIKIAMGVAVGVTLLPTTIFIFVRPIIEG